MYINIYLRNLNIFVPSSRQNLLIFNNSRVSNKVHIDKFNWDLLWIAYVGIYVSSIHRLWLDACVNISLIKLVWICAKLYTYTNTSASKANNVCSIPRA